MRATLIIAIRIAIATAVFLVASFLPLIPALQAPTSPDPVYESTLVSLQDLVGVGIFRLGVNHQATWATLPAMILLTAASLAGGWALSGLLFRSRSSSSAGTPDRKSTVA